MQGWVVYVVLSKLLWGVSGFCHKPHVEFHVEFSCSASPVPGKYAVAKHPGKILQRKGGSLQKCKQLCMKKGTCKSFQYCKHNTCVLYNKASEATERQCPPSIEAIAPPTTMPSSSIESIEPCDMDFGEGKQQKPTDPRQDDCC